MLKGMGTAAVIAATAGGALAFAPVAEETVEEFATSTLELMQRRAAPTPFYRGVLNRG
jgi:hypothetical protein